MKKLYIYFSLCAVLLCGACTKEKIVEVFVEVPVAPDKDSDQDNDQDQDNDKDPDKEPDKDPDKDKDPVEDPTDDPIVDVDIFENYPVSEEPVWEAKNTSTQYTMTMVTVPKYKSHEFSVGDDDQLAVFVDGVCCGTGTVITIVDKNIFFMMIHQDLIPSSKLEIRYYNKSRSMIFNNNDIEFYVDKVLGTPDEPYILLFQ